MAQTYLRKNINSLSKDEQERFVDAIKTMMRDQDGSSVYSEIAYIHAYYCSHGQESFPVWHRIYILEFERKLREADILNGKDGNISLPYWDWTNEHFIPPIITKNFTELPEHFNIKLNRGSEETISSNLKSSNLRESVMKALNLPEHWRFASTRWSGLNGESIEVPHNKVHVACGYPMGDVIWASFDPLFFLHHSNVDRIYESYLKINKNSKKEFVRFQRGLAQSGDIDLYKQPLDPFIFPNSQTLYKAADLFKIKNLGYEYDTLIEQEEDTSTNNKYFAYFPDIKIMSLEGNTYQLHVFVSNKEKVHLPIPNDVASFRTMKEYAGMSAIFTKGPGCINCERRVDLQLYVEITEQLNVLNIERINVVLIVKCVITSDMNLPIVDIEDTNIPSPIIIGPAFINPDKTIRMFDTLSSQLKKSDIEDLLTIQRYLNWAGFLSNKCYEQGTLCSETKKAIKLLQEATGRLSISGDLDKYTKSFILHPRCALPEKGSEDVPVFKFLAENNKMELLYWVGTQYCMLERVDTLLEIANAFDVWSQQTKINFKRTSSKDKAAIEIYWTTQFMTEKLKWFPVDSFGTRLAYTKKNQIVFDTTEIWRLHLNKDKISAKQNEFYLLPAAIHQIGHVLGLKKHSSNYKDAMNAFHSNDSVFLQTTDIKRIIQIYDENLVI